MYDGYPTNSEILSYITSHGWDPMDPQTTSGKRLSTHQRRELTQGHRILHSWANDMSRTDWNKKAVKLEHVRLLRIATANKHVDESEWDSQTAFEQDLYG